MTHPLFSTYVALWKRIERDGCYVMYAGGAPQYEGTYQPPDDDHDSGRIRIQRQFYCEPNHAPHELQQPNVPPGTRPVDIPSEVFTMAHEYGHHLSFKARLQSQAYRDAAMKIADAFAQGAIPALAEAEKNLIRDEERRAWSNARRVLREEGFTDSAAFDAREKRDLDRYEEIFAGRLFEGDLA